MSAYLIPSIVYTTELHKYIVPTYADANANANANINTNNNTGKVIINKTLHKYLNTLKAQIDECEMSWDKYKKYTNPYEFIHTTVPNSRQSICAYKPLSRSFFKMIEMSNMLNILADLPADKCKTFHLAEGPGGFIEAMVFLRKNPADYYYGMTLLEEHNQNVPGWRKSKNFLEENPNVIIEKGLDGKGDLMNARNLIHCFKNYKGQFDLITGDGGFDFSVHYHSQEMVSAALIICQVSFAIALQKIGGSFIIKMFDTFSKISLDIIFLLSNIYETVHFVKPHTSRYANSEKYIICKKFKLDEKARHDLINSLFKIIAHMQHDTQSEPDQHTVKQPHIINSLFQFNLPYYFINKIEEYNAIFGQQQVENIGTTLNLIDNSKYDKLEVIKKYNIQKCITWCQQHKIEYNASVQPNNIFLMNKTTHAIKGTS
uniref:Ribosomal RNA methyltransferase FtsJ domain-containing protein n=1 Tax=viral metagenome TaxID=1070528 RepID=A0A6C0II33_9ZZZZ